MYANFQSLDSCLVDVKSLNTLHSFLLEGVFFRGGRDDSDHSVCVSSCQQFFIFLWIYFMHLFHCVQTLYVGTGQLEVCFDSWVSCIYWTKLLTKVAINFKWELENLVLNVTLLHLSECVRTNFVAIYVFVCFLFVTGFSSNIIQILTK